MAESGDDTLVDLALPGRFKWVWLVGLVGVGVTFILLIALHRTFSDLIIISMVGLLWILAPLVCLFTTLVRRYGFKRAIHYLDLGLSVEDMTSSMPTVEDKKSFFEMAKNASTVSLDATVSSQDLCAICLDEEDMDFPLITLRCGHVFHERCIDSVIDTAYEKMYAPQYLGLPILPREKVLSSLRCPLCRSQITQVNRDIEQGYRDSVTENHDAVAGDPPPSERSLARTAAVTGLSELGEFNIPYSSDAVSTPTFAAITRS